MSLINDALKRAKQAQRSGAIAASALNEALVVPAAPEVAEPILASGPVEAAPEMPTFTEETPPVFTAPAQKRFAPPPPPSLDLEPAEPPQLQPARLSLGLAVPVGLAGLALLALLFAWVIHHRGAEPKVVAAKVEKPAPQVAASVPPPAVNTTRPVAPKVSAAPIAPNPSAVTTTTPAANTLTPAAVSPPAVVAEKPVASSPVPQTVSSTSPAPSVAEPAPQPAAANSASAPLQFPEPIVVQQELPPMKLGAIIFSPKHPSAMINGRTFFVGDKYGDLQVVSITQSGATLSGGGRTVVLTLP